MELRDIVFEPQNDMHAECADLVREQENLIRQERYDDAVILLSDNAYKGGFRASLFNGIQNKIRALSHYLLNEYAANEDECYSDTEPSEEQMEGKNFWIKTED